MTDTGGDLSSSGFGFSTRRDSGSKSFKAVDLRKSIDQSHSMAAFAHSDSEDGDRDEIAMLIGEDNADAHQLLVTARATESVTTTTTGAAISASARATVSATAIPTTTTTTHLATSGASSSLSTTTLLTPDTNSDDLLLELESSVSRSALEDAFRSLHDNGRPGFAPTADSMMASTASSMMPPGSPGYPLGSRQQHIFPPQPPPSASRRK
eukprot:GEZU01020424.1.p1 GENE.GEZU01020424.1~~GEZU01020424.1.p1  ORF type:complete len:210 (+),score=37.68 GEZU01020424.1:750-1379(+)